ncbi:hypothetical protein OAT37_05695 [Alphaproteobacteria bacterium]|nr:hypothetical protein [Alphaproteobacteria bacterium]
MKRLLLMLSLICFSWGAGANSAYAVEYFDLISISRPLQECLEAKKNGIHLKSNYYFYEGFIKKLGFREHANEIELVCYLYEKK